MSSHPLISIQYVSKTYSNDILQYDQHVLKNVSLEIHDGEFVIIFGPSGSGKSTLLNLLAGLEMPSAGRVLVRNRDLTRFTSEDLARYHRLKMGMVFQSFNLVKSLNVWENVALPQTADKVRYWQRRKRAKQLLTMFKLDQYMNRHVNELSGGEQQRVAIARALINNPFFLLVDEPTGNLDSKAADEVMGILYGLHAHSKHTLVLVTHNPNYLHFASRIIYMQDGQMLKEVYQEPSLEGAPKIISEKNYRILTNEELKQARTGEVIFPNQPPPPPPEVDVNRFVEEILPPRPSQAVVQPATPPAQVYYPPIQVNPPQAPQPESAPPPPAAPATPPPQTENPTNPTDIQP